MGKSVNFTINLLIGLVVLFVAGVYVYFRSQELPGYALYMYAVYAVMVIAFIWVMKGSIKTGKAEAQTQPAKKPAAKTAPKPAAKTTGKAKEESKPAKKTA